MLNRKSLLFIFILWTSIASSQSNSDFQLWTGANAKLKLNDKWSLSLAPELRFADTISTLKNVISELGIKYSITKSISFLAEYRYTIRPGKNDVNRFCIGAAYDWSKKDFPIAFSYRTKFQYSRNMNSGNSESYFRNKIGVDFNLSKLVDPFVSYEIFFLFGKNEFRNTRYSIGLNWKLGKNLSLSTYYIYQREIYVKTPSSDHICGVTLNYRMKLKKKKGQPSVE